MNLKTIIEKLRFYRAKRSSAKYIHYLRSKGIKIGKGTIIMHPRTVTIDFSRPTLLSIGENVRLNKDITIQTHDYASQVFVNRDCEFLPSSAPIRIGNNVYFGQQCTVLKGVTIGDNCIIGFGSIVTKDIPANSVATGRPAKVVCSLDDYLQKRMKASVEESIKYAISIIESGREPIVEDFFDDYPCFVDGENYQDYNYPYNRVFNAEQFETWKKKHNKTFNGFEDFMRVVRNRINNK